MGTPVHTANLLVVYHSVDGHTALIAQRIARHLREGGAVVSIAEAGAAPAPGKFDVVVAGGPIHAGQHSKELTAYLTTHAPALREVPVALFQVSLTSAERDPEHQATAGGYVAALTSATGLEPRLVARFAGALRYTAYGRLKRAFMRRIAASGGHATDTSTDHVLTDWDEVDGFAEDVLQLTRSLAT